MTGQEIITEIREYLNEPVDQADYYTDAKILEIANLVFHSLNEQVGFSLDQTNQYISETEMHNEIPWVVGQTRYDLPTDFIRVDDKMGVWCQREEDFQPYYTDGYKMEKKPMSGAPYDDFNSHTNGTPVMYDIFGVESPTKKTYIDIEPPPAEAVSTMVVTYVARPDDITLTTEPLFEKSLHNIVVHGVCEILATKHGFTNAAVYHNNQYSDLLSDLKEFYSIPSDNLERRRSVYQR